jgi:hypothetical protein
MVTATPQPRRPLNGLCGKGLRRLSARRGIVNVVGWAVPNSFSCISVSPRETVLMAERLVDFGLVTVHGAERERPIQARSASEWVAVGRGQKHSLACASCLYWPPPRERLLGLTEARRHGGDGGQPKVWIPAAARVSGHPSSAVSCICPRVLDPEARTREHSRDISPPLVPAPVRPRGCRGRGAGTLANGGPIRPGG